jgi:hypothetical protein
MVKIPELTVDDVFTRLDFVGAGAAGEILVLPERIRSLYVAVARGGTMLDMGEEEGYATVEGTVHEVAAKVVATMNRRRQKEFETNAAIDAALDLVLMEEAEKLMDDDDDVSPPPRSRKKKKQ